MKKIDWQADLEQLAVELPRLHKNLFYASNREQFFTSIENLKQSVSSIDTFTLLMEIARIVADIKDAHTAVVLPKFNRLPLDCYWFKEGIYITNTLPQYEELLQGRISGINGLSIEDVIAVVSRVISHENQSFLKSQLPDYLVCAEILYGLEIIDEFDKVKVSIERINGELLELELPTLKYAEWENATLLRKAQAGIDPKDAELPLYRRNRDQFYWYDWYYEKRLLYVNYNHCKDMLGYSVADFSQKLKQEIEANSQIEKLVIDLRNNGGGSSELFRGFLDWISRHEHLNRAERLQVIVGRDTFSSALLNAYYLRFHTQAVFLGEATGGKPNHYGEVKYLTLNSSGLTIRYSTQYYPLVEEDDLLSLIPDVICEVTFRDYRQNFDPCLDWIANHN